MYDYRGVRISQASQPQKRGKASWLMTAALGLVLSALPVAAITSQASRVESGVRMSFPVIVERTSTQKWLPRLSVTSSLHQLNYSALSGDKSFSPGQRVYVFYSKSGQIWYPYAILKSLPEGDAIHQDGTVMLRARVAQADHSRLKLSYDFDDISPSAEVVRSALRKSRQNINLEIAVDERGVASVSALVIDGRRYDQRVTLNAVLDGGRSTGASSMPPR